MTREVPKTTTFQLTKALKTNLLKQTAKLTNKLVFSKLLELVGTVEQNVFEADRCIGVQAFSFVQQLEERLSNQVEVDDAVVVSIAVGRLELDAAETGVERVRLLNGEQLNVRVGG